MKSEVHAIIADRFRSHAMSSSGFSATYKLRLPGDAPRGPRLRLVRSMQHHRATFFISSRSFHVDGR
jgi:hypothetical protein